MRMIRGLAAALAIAALAPLTGEAQQGRSFRDAWFWGLKGGAMNFSTATESNQQAALAGVDWVITRTRGGLYVSFDQAFVNRDTYVIDSDPFTGDLFARNVAIDGLSRLNVMALGFPLKNERVRPYFGLGLAVSRVGSATPSEDPPFETFEQAQLVDEQISNQKTAFSPAGMIGVQAQVAGVHLFAQTQVTAANRNFFLSGNGGGVNASLELGVRYNIGRAIDR